ncbi:hypothetical protein HPP92_026806 [Vanilla planifolia]|uniref:Uncharacterized protein n=1 Tax=Vanilla planifolia TaxID=51239 RepID=A0A835PFV9_VANPL|nr:hypothetical protein HPP92_026806 [Vanilla planifolia]
MEVVIYTIAGRWGSRGTAKVLLNECIIPSTLLALTKDFEARVRAAQQGVQDAEAPIPPMAGQRPACCPVGPAPAELSMGSKAVK